MKKNLRNWHLSLWLHLTLISSIFLLIFKKIKFLLFMLTDYNFLIHSVILQSQQTICLLSLLIALITCFYSIRISKILASIKIYSNLLQICIRESCIVNFIMVLIQRKLLPSEWYKITS